MELYKLEEYIEKYSKNGGQSNEVITEITTALKNRDLLLVTLVEKIGWLLSSEDKSCRLTGLSLLVQVLQDAGHIILSLQEVESLMTFFCSRLSDHHDFLPMTLEGLVFLSSYPDLTESQAQTILKGIFSEIHAAAQLQDDRRKLYSIICNLLENNVSALQHMGSEFVLSYIQTMDGERDPRCLMLAFKIVTIISTQFDLGKHVEDLFDVVACYFPVDFRAPEHDPFGISREELSDALEKCLASSDLFAPFCFPLILEKLNSELDSAKLESLSLLRRCSSSNGSRGLKIHLRNIWSAIRREVFSGRDETISTASLECLKSIVSSLSHTENEHTTFVDLIWKECSGVIQGDSELSVVSASILKAVFSGCPTPQRTELLNKAIPYMTHVLKETEGVQRSSHLQALAVILDVPTLGTSGSWNCPIDCWSLLVSLLSPEEDNIRPTSTYCWLAIDKLLQIGSNLPESENLPLAQRILAYVSHKNCTPLLRKTLTGTCASLTKTYPEVSKTYVIPGLLQLLSDGDIAVDILSSICSTDDSIAELSILNPLMQNLSVGFSHELALCRCLESLAHTRKGNLYLDHLSEPYLYPILEKALVKVYQENYEFHNWPLFLAIEAMIAALSPTAGLQVAQDLLLVVFSNKTCVKWKLVVPTSFQSLPHGAKLSLGRILLSVLPHLSPSADPCPFHEIIPWLVAQSDWDHEQHMAQTTAALANKCFICGRIAFKTISEYEPNNNLILFLIWITKGLLLSGHQNVTEAIKMLLDLLADHQHGQAVANGFETILKPASNVMKPSSHAQIALFHAQRLFSLTAPILLKSYQESKSDPNSRSNCLSALCCQLKYLPLPVLKHELPQLMPILVAALEQRKGNDGLDILQSSLGALALLLGSQNSHLATSHLSMLIPHLTEIANGHSSMTIRIEALKCLLELAKLPTSDILVYSGDVLHALKSCLDDKKRLVRKEAARTSCQWHLVGLEPGE